MFALLCGLGLLTACAESGGPGTINLVPAPIQSAPTAGASFALKGNSVINYSHDATRAMALQLADFAERYAGLRLSVADGPTSENPGGGIFLALTTRENPALAQLPTAYGVSAKDGDPSDERYALTIDTREGVLIEASAAEGLFRGITSLKQLMVGNFEGQPGATLYLPALQVADGPRFAWRGLSLDVCRCFFTVDQVKQVIDLLAYYKFNVLHMHLTDNEGWRIEIEGYPKLTEVGGTLDNEGKPVGFYTKAQYQELAAYAAERFITIVPEIDLPGHTKALFAAYPDLRDATRMNIDLNMSGQAIGALDVDDPKAMALVERVITELAEMTPGSYIHIGGDETWGLAEDKYIRFVDKARQMVKEKGKKVVGWQESARTHLEPGDVMQYWVHYKQPDPADRPANSDTASETRAEIPQEVREMMAEMFKKNAADMGLGLEKQAKIILSPSAFCYLDHPYKEASRDSLQSDRRFSLGLQAYARQTIADMYAWDPMTFNERLDASQHVAGVEAAIWCETIRSFDDLQFLLLPRLAGVSEKGWSAVEKTGWEEYRERLATHARLWDFLGWDFYQSSLVDWR